MMKKTLSAVLAVALCLGVWGMTGCNGTSKNVEKGATVITMYVQDFEDWSNEHMSQMVDAFNADLTDGIQLEVKFFLDEAYTDALTVARENGKAPDIFMTSYGNLYNNSIVTGYAEPLNDLLDEKYFDDLLDNVAEMVRYDGKYYAYPQLLEPSTLFFYRKDYLEKAGVTGGAPTTWDELLAACAAVKPTLRKGQYTLGLPIGTALGWASWGMQLNTAGTLAVNDRWTECLVDSQGYRDLCGFFYDVYAGGYAPAGNVSATGYNDIIEALCQDKLAMTFAGSWSIAEILNTYPDMAHRIGVAAIPTKTGEAGKPTATNGGWTYSISSTSSNKQKAARVLEWFFCEDAARTAQYFEAAQYSKAAVNKSVQEYLNQTVTDSHREWMTVVNSVAELSPAEPTYAWDISTAVAGMFEYMAINSDKNKNTIIEAQIAECVGKINTILRSPGFQTNPNYKG